MGRAVSDWSHILISRIKCATARTTRRPQVSEHRPLRSAPQWNDCHTPPLSNWAYRGRGRVTGPRERSRHFTSHWRRSDHSPEAPIQARAAAASVQREYRSPNKTKKSPSLKVESNESRKCLIKEKRTSQRSRWVKKKKRIVSLCFNGCGNFDACCCTKKGEKKRKRKKNEIPAPRRWSEKRITQPAGASPAVRRCLLHCQTLPMEKLRTMKWHERLP